MADRVLTFSLKDYKGGSVMMLPSYYLEVECAPKAVRIHAGTAPSGASAKFEIYDDGVSIMNDRSYEYSTYRANTATYTGNYDIELCDGESSTLMAEDFNETQTMEAGSWITCYITQGGSAKDITVQLELDVLSDGDEDTD